MAKKMAKPKRWAYWYVDDNRYEWRYSSKGNEVLIPGRPGWEPLTKSNWPDCLTAKNLVRHARSFAYPNFRPKPGYPPLPGTEPVKAKPVTREKTFKGWALVSPSGYISEISRFKDFRRSLYAKNIVRFTGTYTPPAKASTKRRK